MESGKTKVLSVIAIVTFLVLIFSATFAYFQAQGGSPTSANLSATTYTTDVFTFATGDAITINADQDSFASGKGNPTSSSYASAKLTANNKTNTATEHYYLYLNISDNTFTYSIDENTPEIIMTITDNNGTEITNISTLNHVVVTGANGAQVSGYDITNTSGLITLFNNREITTTSSKEERWNITVTFVNYDVSQNANAGKSMSAKVMIQKEAMPLHESCNDNTLACHVAKLYTGTQGANNIYYHDGALENGAVDNSYRYAGPSDTTNNFVCFGSSASTCPTDNLYRIIGVFGDQVKLIKYDYATRDLLGNGTGSGVPIEPDYKGSLSIIDLYHWNNETGSNTWSESLLNKTNLNVNFITNIGTEWAQKIAMTTWKVGGNTWAHIGTQPAKTAYQNEIVSPVTTNTTDGKTEYSAKIGLMYVSDYGFAAAPSTWTTKLSSYSNSSVTTVNWMYMGYNEWTISRDSNSDYAYQVSFGGEVYSEHFWKGFAVRPVFFLTSDVTYVSGDGSQNSPIRLSD